MNCNCFEQTETALREVLESAPSPLRPNKAIRLGRVAILGQALRLNGPEVTAVYNVPVIVTWDMESGSIKRSETSVQASFCPFCGQSLPEEPSEISKPEDS